MSPQIPEQSETKRQQQLAAVEGLLAQAHVGGSPPSTTPAEVDVVRGLLHGLIPTRERHTSDR